MRETKRVAGALALVAAAVLGAACLGGQDSQAKGGKEPKGGSDAVAKVGDVSITLEEVINFAKFGVVESVEVRGSVAIVTFSEDYDTSNEPLASDSHVFEMAVPAGAVQHRVSARVNGVHIGARIDEQSHDLCIAVAGRVVDGVVAPAVECRCQLRMPAQQRTHPRGVSEKNSRQELPCVVGRSDAAATDHRHGHAADDLGHEL